MRGGVSTQKQLSIIAITFFTLIAVAGCVYYEPGSAVRGESNSSYRADDIQQYSESLDVGEIIGCQPIPQLLFLSLEKFLDTYVATRRGMAMGSRTPIIAEAIDLPSLTSIHIPTKIPETFRLARISVTERSVALHFMPATKDFTNDYTNELWNVALSSRQYFLLMFDRYTYEDMKFWGHSSPLDGIMNQFGFTEEDLIDGRYYIRETFSGMLELYWAEGSTLFSLRMPRTIHESSAIVGFSADDVVSTEVFTLYDMLHFTETITIDLQDEANIAAWSAGDFAMLEDVLR